ncbi:MAG: histidine kinase [Gammaproteobacteria bacterium]
MARTMIDTTPPLNKQYSTLHSRLLVRLTGLLVILGLSILLFVLNGLATASPLARGLLGALLFLAGGGLIASIMILVQQHLLNPLSQIKAWARKMRDGRYTDPIPASTNSACAEITDDLNRLGKRLAPASRRDPAGRREQDLEQHSTQILYEVVSSINTAHGLDDLLSRFLHTLKRITRAQAAVVWFTPNHGQMDLASSSGFDESLLVPERQDVRRSLYERAVTEGKIWVENDLKKSEKIAGRSFFDRQDIGLVSIPMRYRGRIIGVINLFLNTDQIERIESAKPLLTTIAHHLSIAFENYQNDEKSCQHLISEERTRIAHELHDSLAQSLASLRYQVRVLDETLHQGDESTTWQQLERIENSLDEANTELRGLIANFRAPTYKRGLLEAIEQIVNQFRNETGIRTYLQKEWSPVPLSMDLETQILRIIQEALWNIRKHSQAKTVRIMLRDTYQGKYRVLIEDDGIGIKKQSDGLPGEHIGLTIMRERAARIGGELHVESEAGEGTRVVLEFSQPEAHDKIK